MEYPFLVWGKGNRAHYVLMQLRRFCSFSSMIYFNLKLFLCVALKVMLNLCSSAASRRHTGRLKPTAYN
jgi:hypothetical protein